MSGEQGDQPATDENASNPMESPEAGMGESAQHDLQLKVEDQAEMQEIPAEFSEEQVAPEMAL